MKIQSERIDTWGTVCTVLGIISIVVGLLAASLDATWGAGLAASGLAMLVYAPLLKGFAVLVRNAEDQIDARERAKMEEDDKVVVDWRAAQNRCKQENENTNG